MTPRRRGARAFWLVVGCALVLFAWARPARADDPEVTASVDSQRVGVGDVLRLSVHIATRQHQVQNPTTGATPGFSVVGGPSTSTSQQISIANGRMVQQRAVDISWSLRAEKVGTWSLGPLSVQVGGSTYRAGGLKVTVVPASQAPPRAAPDPFGTNPFDPFGTGPDPFKGLLDSMNGQPQARDRYGIDPKLSLDEAPGTVAFLHATIDRTHAVVGQQVTVSMYIYVDSSTRDPGIYDVHEATAADFVKRPLFEDDNSDRALSRASVGGRLFNVRLLRKWALFPLKTGSLEVTPMELTLQRTRATGEPLRKSELLKVDVTEPPTDHRPPGFQQGDVGQFSLTAETTPRDIEEDGAVGVTLTLEGTGNLPSMITPPAQAGLEWLPPEVHEKVGAAPGQPDAFGGKRVFAYVLRLHKTGDIKLGTIALPYWDPIASHYSVARADLGLVTVRPSRTPKAAKELPPDPFATAPDPRTQMGLTKASGTHLVEAHPNLFWLALSASPLSFVLFAGASRTVRTVRERSAERAASPETELRSKLAVAEAAARAGDARALSSATARALEAATVAYADVNVRDAVGGESKARLVAAAVPESLASEIDEVLAECALARFSPEPPELGEARARWKQAKNAIERLRSES